MLSFFIDKNVLRGVTLSEAQFSIIRNYPFPFSTKCVGVFRYFIFENPFRYINNLINFTGLKDTYDDPDKQYIYDVLNGYTDTREVNFYYLYNLINRVYGGVSLRTAVLRIDMEHDALYLNNTYFGIRLYDTNNSFLVCDV
jgi:hypothetical protein